MAVIDAGRQTGRARSYTFVGRTLVFVVLAAVAVSVARPAGFVTPQRHAGMIGV